MEKINSCPVETSTPIYLRCLITTLQMLTLSLFLKKEKESYDYMSIPWVVECKGECCHFLLTIAMGEKRAALKTRVGGLICIRVKPVWLSSVNATDIFKLLREEVLLVGSLAEFMLTLYLNTCKICSYWTSIDFLILENCHSAFISCHFFLGDIM